ncbi:lipopolysaccharide assembly protein LapA domain-containing protein [Pseudomonas sp. 58 R 12]|uniref:lipopolysaccharide assembly protein LapA domain-containing protein n=1 Tax=Pseudomonas sp. 58 R 12 TaxID=1844107 RepID=UPI000812465C|nr:lipopolysaccharide assembly protein LapA domain-containing protein [Pseudomonas sp. 58 R 12]CRM43765.1 putative integral membrane protein [Pseudomonas sp. 58 R 12]
MHWVKRVVTVLITLVIALMVLVFVLENQQEVSLSFLGVGTGQMPLSVFVVVALVVGMLVGPLLTFLVRHRRGRSIPVGRS